MSREDLDAIATAEMAREPDVELDGLQDACQVPVDALFEDADMSELYAALAAAVVTALTRELLAWADHRARVRGRKRTRAEDERTFGP